MKEWLHICQNTPVYVYIKPQLFLLYPTEKRIVKKEFSLSCKTSTSTHWGWVVHMHQWIRHHWFRKWLVACSVPGHYLNQCCIDLSWTPGNKFQWNWSQSTAIFIQENMIENAVCKMSSVLCQPQWVNIRAPGGNGRLFCRIHFETLFPKSLKKTEQ